MTDQTNINEQPASNSGELLDLGHKAIAALRNGEREQGKGESLMRFVLISAWDRVVFNATVPGSKTRDEDTFSFELDDYADRDNSPLFRNENGNRDNVNMKAAKVSVFRKLFDVDLNEVDAAQAASFIQRLEGGLADVVQLRKMGVADKVTLNKQNILCVPRFVVQDAPTGRDATEENLNIYAKTKDDNVALDGKKNRSIRHLSQRIKPQVEKREGSSGQGKVSTPDKGKVMTESVAFIRATLKALQSEKAGEDVKALNNEQCEALKALVLEAGAYLQAATDVSDKAKKAA